MRYFMFCNPIVLHYRRHQKNHTINVVEKSGPKSEAVDLVFSDPLIVKAVSEQDRKALQKRSIAHNYNRVGCSQLKSGQIKTGLHNILTGMGMHPQSFVQQTLRFALALARIS
jgi:hypothetical protein